MKKQYAFEIVFLLLLSLAPFLWVGGGWVILGHDSGFRPMIEHHMHALWNNWYWTVNTGVDWSLFKGFLIAQAPDYIFQMLFGSLEKAQPFILSFWFFVIAMGMYIFLYGFFPEKKSWFLRLFGSTFWIWNFYVLQGWTIAERAKFSLYAALPVSIFIFFAAFQRRISVFSGAVLFGLLYFFLNGGGSPPLYGASMMVWGITFLYLTIASIKKEKKKGMFLAARIGISFFLCLFLFNAYWIFVQMDLYKNTYATHVASEGGIQGLLAWEQVVSRYASIINLLRLQGFPDWYNNPHHPFSIEYLTNPILVFLSFLPIIIIFFGMVRFRQVFQDQTKGLLLRLLLAFFVVGLFFAAGSHKPTGYLYILFMKFIPGFAIFRSSFYKFAPLLWFTIIVFFSVFLNQCLDRLPRKIRLVSCGVFLLGIILYHYPFFTTKFFQFSPQFTTRLTIPSYVKDAASHLDLQSSPFGRVLLLPRLDAGFINEPIDTYEWGFYSLDILPGLVSRRKFVANDDIHEIVESLYLAFYEGDMPRFRARTKILGITHVLYRHDVAFSSDEEKEKNSVPLDLLQKRLGDITYAAVKL